MDFEVTYTEEQQRFRREVRAWLEASVPAAVQRTPTSPEDNYQRYLELRALGRKLGAKGWLYPTAPAKYGGGGLDVDYAIILEEEVDRFDLSLPPYYDSGGRLGSASILVWGTEEQRQTFLPPIYRGEVRTWQLLTEPGAGSDLAGVRMTTAVRDGDDYVIKGQKIFVGSDNGADRIWLIACTAPNGRRHENLSWFMIDASLPGISMQPMELMGTGGEGGRIGRNRVWDRLLRYCQETKRDGVPLTQQPDVRDSLADIYIKTEITRLFGLRNFYLTYARKPKSYEGPQLSYYRKTAGLWMTGAILEAVGPAALTTDPTWGSSAGFLETQQRNGIVSVHPGGTTDIQRVQMARRIGIGRSTREKAGTVHGAEA